MLEKLSVLWGNLCLQVMLNINWSVYCFRLRENVQIKLLTREITVIKH